jgi:hypothetical protein
LIAGRAIVDLVEKLNDLYKRAINLTSSGLAPEVALQRSADWLRSCSQDLLTPRPLSFIHLDDNDPPHLRNKAVGIWDRGQEYERQEFGRQPIIVGTK